METLERTLRTACCGTPGAICVAVVDRERQGQGDRPLQLAGSPRKTEGKGDSYLSHPTSEPRPWPGCCKG